MLGKIEHIGIAVKDLQLSVALYEKLLGIPCFKTEEVDSEKVMTAFFQLDGLKIELLAATDESSSIARFIEKRGEGVHHIAFEAPDLEAESKRLEADGFLLINATSKAGADNKLINFIHPQTTGKVLIELCMDKV